MASMEERFVFIFLIYAAPSTSRYGAWVGFFSAAGEVIDNPSFEGGRAQNSFATRESARGSMVVTRQTCLPIVSRLLPKVVN
jgi:hypothetical protein